MNVVLGDAAADVTDLSLHYSMNGDGDRDSARDVAMHFERGKAPRVVHHEARLADGEYVVAIEVRGEGDPVGRSWADARRVALRGGGSTSIDVSERAFAALHGSAR